MSLWESGLFVLLAQEVEAVEVESFLLRMHLIGQDSDDFSNSPIQNDVLHMHITIGCLISRRYGRLDIPAGFTAFLLPFASSLV